MFFLCKLCKIYILGYFKKRIKLYINCKFEALFKLLDLFQRDRNFLLSNFFPTFNLNETEQDLKYVYKHSTRQLFTFAGIQEEAHDIVIDLIPKLKEALSKNKIVLIKVDAYQQNFSTKFFHKKHLKHNLLIYGYNSTNDACIVFEYIYPLSSVFKEQIFKATDISIWYNEYVKYFYKSKKDIGATYYEYSLIKEPRKVNFLKKYKILLKKNTKRFLMSQEEISRFLENFDNCTKSDQEKYTLILLRLMKIFYFQITSLSKENAEKTPLLNVLSSTIDTLNLILLKINKKLPINDNIIQSLYKNEIIFKNLLEEWVNK